jgi:hypothetical protein
MTKTVRGVAFTAAILFAGLSGTNAMAEPNRVTFPENFDQYVQYGDYSRGSGGELAFALPETIEIAKSGLPLPYGTRLVLGIRRDNAVASYFVMEKGEGFGFDFSEELRTDDWQFQQFDLNGQVVPETNTAECAACHSRAPEDYRFTIDRMLAYVP